MTWTTAPRTGTTGSQHQELDELSPPGDAVVRKAIDLLLEDVTNAQKSSPLSPMEVPDERLTIQELRARIQYIKLAFKTVEKGFVRRVASADRVVNSHTAIHQLPTEILIRIFIQALKDFHIDRYYQAGLAKLRGVSFAWCTIIEHTPELWSMISIYHSASQIEKSIDKSKDASLTINSLNYYGGEESRQSFHNAIYPHFPRVMSADMHCDNVAQILSLVNPPTPRLTHFRLSSGTLETLELPPTFAPLLRSLSLLRVTIPWDSPTLNNLSYLSIRTVGRNGPTIPQILHILRSSPMLESLDLADLDPPDASPSLGDDLIPLPRLQSLCLNLSISTAQQILARIEVSACKTFLMTCSGSPTSLQDLLYAMDQFAPLLRSDMSNAVRLTLTDDLFSLKSRSLDIDIILRLPPFHMLIEWTVEASRGGGVGQDGFEVNLGFCPTDGALYEVLDLLPIKRLAAEAGWLNHWTLIESLGKQNQASPRWLFGRLEFLEVHGDLDPRGIVHMVSSRQPDATRLPAGAMPPCRIEELRIEGYERWRKTDRKALKNALGDGKALTLKGNEIAT